jgi:adenylate kinase
MADPGAASLVYGFLTTAPKAVVEPIRPKAISVIPATPTRLPQTRERELTGNKGSCLLATWKSG